MSEHATEAAPQRATEVALDPPRRSGRGSRLALSAFFVGAGINHFRNPRFYEAIVPPSLKDDAGLVVQVSGVAELIGGLAVLVPGTRRLSGLWLIALLVAVFPANIYMAREPEHFKKIPRWALYARLPLQPLAMLWTWKATRR